MKPLTMIVAAFAAGELCVPGYARAQTVEVAPFVGYRFGGDFFELVTNQRVDVDETPTLGAAVNVPLHDGLQFEALFTHQRAQLATSPGRLQPPAQSRITVDHWLAGGLQEFGRGRTHPFLTGMLGLTRYAGAGDSEVRFAISAGGGVKLWASRHLGARFDGRVFTTFVDVDGQAIACSPGICFFAFHADIVWQAEFTAGVVIALGAGKPSAR